MGIWKYDKKIIEVKKEIENTQPTVQRLEEKSKNLLEIYNKNYSNIESKFNSFSNIAVKIVSETMQEQQYLKNTVNQIMTLNTSLSMRMAEIIEIFDSGNFTPNNPLVNKLLESINTDIKKSENHTKLLNQELEKRNKNLENMSSQMRNIDFGNEGFYR